MGSRNGVAGALLGAAILVAGCTGGSPEPTQPEPTAPPASAEQPTPTQATGSATVSPAADAGEAAASPTGSASPSATSAASATPAPSETPSETESTRATRPPASASAKPSAPPATVRASEPPAPAPPHEHHHELEETARAFLACSEDYLALANSLTPGPALTPIDIQVWDERYQRASALAAEGSYPAAEAACRELINEVARAAR